MNYDQAFEPEIVSIYTCVFCDLNIESTLGNPCQILISTIIDEKKTEQRSDLPCHMDCFKKQLTSDLQSDFYLESLFKEKNEAD